MPMSLTEINNCLRQLRLSGMRETLDARALQVTQANASFIEGFSWLLQDEIDRRNSKAMQSRYKRSGVDEQKCFQDFDWGYNPKIPKNTCFELLSLKFIQSGNNVVIIGSPGTGKSHVAKSLICTAMTNGYKAIYRDAYELYLEIEDAEQRIDKRKLMRIYQDAEVVLIDDLFLRKLPIGAADLLQDIILLRYKAKKSTIITSNRDIEDWGKLFGDNAIASAIQDRLMHNGYLLHFEGKSWRLKEAAERLAKKPEKK